MVRRLSCSRSCSRTRAALRQRRPAYIWYRGGSRSRPVALSSSTLTVVEQPTSVFLILLRRLVQRSSSAAAVEAPMAVQCAILRMVATFARGRPAAAGSRGCAAHRQSLLRRLWRHRHHIGCVRAARSPSTATRPAHLLAVVACARRSAGRVSRGRRSRVRCASVVQSSKAVGRRIP